MDGHSLRKAVEAHRTVYSTPDALESIRKSLEASQAVYSTPDALESIRKSLEASRAVFSTPDALESIRKSLEATAGGLAEAGLAIPEIEVQVDAESVPESPASLEAWADFIGRLSPIGRLVVLNAMIGLLQVLLLQVGPSSSGEVTGALQRGLAWVQAIINAIVAIDESRP